jgi:outer membrane protein OmpA-like peptidoglycan-associated protein
MKPPVAIAALAGVAMIGGSSIFVEQQVRASKERLENPKAVEETPETKVAVADHAEADYCTPKFKEVLARVVLACGLSGQDARRGCEPVDVRSFSSISDEDFNDLFDPLVDRGGIVLFDDNSDVLDDGGKKLIEEKWAERKGARYFFIVARASKTGAANYNEALSQRRANSVFFHLESTASKDDGPLDKMVGMLWLGSQYAQLSKDYCGTWNLSRPNIAAPNQPKGQGQPQRALPKNSKACTDEAINRSAFISWVDCRL